MVIWMFANDGDISTIEEFLHYYRLRRSKDPSYWEFKPWGRSSRLVFNFPSSLQNWKKKLFLRLWWWWGVHFGWGSRWRS